MKLDSSLIDYQLAFRPGTDSRVHQAIPGSRSDRARSIEDSWHGIQYRVRRCLQDTRGFLASVRILASKEFTSVLAGPVQQKHRPNNPSRRKETCDYLSRRWFAF
jgi:hypothetical protein